MKTQQFERTQEEMLFFETMERLKKQVIVIKGFIVKDDIITIKVDRKYSFPQGDLLEKILKRLGYTQEGDCNHFKISRQELEKRQKQQIDQMEEDELQEFHKCYEEFFEKAYCGKV